MSISQPIPVNDISSTEYYRRFEIAAAKYQARLTRLEQGGYIATVGNGTRVALMSGLHGDERSGPLAILEWLEQTQEKKLIPDGYQLWIAPLVNSLGWDHQSREWNSLDLNRLFNASAPPFLKSIMASLSSPLPCLFLDLHEDSDYRDLYIYHYVGDQHDADVELAQVLGARLQTWSDFGPWQGSGEVFLREQGCNQCITVEIPPTWELPDRIRCARQAIRWMLDNVPKFC